MIDILIKNVEVIDGTKTPAYKGNVGIRNGKILLRGMTEETEARKVIDGSGLYLTPGFIDAHSHGDGVFGTDIGRECKINQGITTEITGQCGSSMFPVIPAHADELKKLLDLICGCFPDEYDTFTSFQNYADYLDHKAQLAANAKQLIGHGSLRMAVMGYQNRRCTPDELELMKTYVREAMEHGALGISSGLIYSPSCFSDTEEIIALCKVVSEYGGVYATHMRNESKDVVKSVEETLRVGREANIPVMISHHKVQGRPYWGLSEQTLELVDKAVSEGYSVTIDEYPYLASMTSLNAIIPPKYFGSNLDGLTEILKDPEMRARIRRDIEDPDTDFENQYINCGGFENIQIAALKETPQYEGMTIAEAAASEGKEPFEQLFDMLAANHCVGSAIYFSMCDEDLCRIFKNRNTVVGTDGLYSFKGQKSHPRAWATFPHAINHFVKEKKIVSLEEMIYKITLLPAQRTFLENKGAIREGWDADLVLMDYEKLKDTADYKHADARCEGIEYVIVNGQMVYHDKKMTGVYPGRLLRHKGRR